MNSFLWFVNAVTNPGVAGMLSLLAVCIYMLRRPESQSAPKLLLFVMAMAAFGPISDAVMDAESAATPLKYDYFLQSIDQTVGLTAFSVAKLLNDHVRSVLFVVYQALIYVMMAWYALSLNLRPAASGKLLIAYVVDFIVGPCLYLIVPGRGPRHAFGALFPQGNPDIAQVLVPLAGWPNAIPSLHVATALLFVFFAWNRALRVFAIVFLLGTIGATLAFEHYVIDLIVAVPFACAAALLGRGEIWKAFANFAIVLAWLLGIRFAAPVLVMSPVLLRIAVTCTLAGAAWTMRTATRRVRREILAPAAVGV